MGIAIFFIIAALVALILMIQGLYSVQTSGNGGNAILAGWNSLFGSSDSKKSRNNSDAGTV